MDSAIKVMSGLLIVALIGLLIFVLNNNIYKQDHAAFEAGQCLTDGLSIQVVTRVYEESATLKAGYELLDLNSRRYTRTLADHTHTFHEVIDEKYCFKQ
jgi:hypothetical protein